MRLFLDFVESDAATAAAAAAAFAAAEASAASVRVVRGGRVTVSGESLSPNGPGRRAPG